MTQFSDFHTGWSIDVFESKKELFNYVRSYIVNHLKLRIEQEDRHRPWGGFFLIDELDFEAFKKLFFSEVSLVSSQRVSPKLLIVLPESRLSWQYHHRRSEYWRILKGKVGIVQSKDDHEKKMNLHKPGDLIYHSALERHRLVGLDNCSLIAEIWVHSDPNHLSNEDDIIRIQDDFKRE